MRAGPSSRFSDLVPSGCFAPIVFLSCISCVSWFTRITGILHGVTPQHKGRNQTPPRALARNRARNRNGRARVRARLNPAMIAVPKFVARMHDPDRSLHAHLQSARICSRLAHPALRAPHSRGYPDGPHMVWIPSGEGCRESDGVCWFAIGECEITGLGVCRT